MRRISSQQTNDDMQYYLMRKQFEMNRVQNQTASQKRIQNLR
jgi:flagellar hook-associated protein 3 FlgL